MSKSGICGESDYDHYLNSCADHYGDCIPQCELCDGELSLLIDGMHCKQCDSLERIKTDYDLEATPGGSTHEKIDWILGEGLVDDDLAIDAQRALKGGAK